MDSAMYKGFDWWPQLIFDIYLTLIIYLFYICTLHKRSKTLLDVILRAQLPCADLPIEISFDQIFDVPLY